MWGVDLHTLRNRCWTCLGVCIAAVFILSAYASAHASGAAETMALGWRDVVFAGAAVLSSACALLVVMLERRIRTTEVDGKLLSKELRDLERAMAKLPDRESSSALLTLHVDPIKEELTRLRAEIDALHRRQDSNGAPYKPPRGSR